MLKNEPIYPPFPYSLRCHYPYQADPKYLSPPYHLCRRAWLVCGRFLSKRCNHPTSFAIYWFSVRCNHSSLLLISNIVGLLSRMFLNHLLCCLSCQVLETWILFDCFSPTFTVFFVSSFFVVVYFLEIDSSRVRSILVRTQRWNGFIWTLQWRCVRTGMYLSISDGDMFVLHVVKSFPITTIQTPVYISAALWCVSLIIQWIWCMLMYNKLSHLFEYIIVSYCSNTA